MVSRVFSRRISNLTWRCSIKSLFVSVKPSPPTESQVELADISLEQDKTELDAFLRSDTDTGKYMLWYLAVCSLTYCVLIIKHLTSSLESKHIFQYTQINLPEPIACLAYKVVPKMPPDDSVIKRRHCNSMIFFAILFLT